MGIMAFLSEQVSELVLEIHFSLSLKRIKILLRMKRYTCAEMKSKILFSVEYIVFSCLEDIQPV